MPEVHTTSVTYHTSAEALLSYNMERAYMPPRQQQPPPTFKPYMIMILVLATGLAIIGLTLTIIGMWPSYSPSGGNPLKIAGPVMLGVGLIGIVGSIVDICYKREKAKDHIQMNVSTL